MQESVLEAKDKKRFKLLFHASKEKLAFSPTPSQFKFSVEKLKLPLLLYHGAKFHWRKYSRYA